MIALYVISDFVPRSVRLIRKKCTCLPIDDVRDRRRERYNRVYVLSRVRNNRVSLYICIKTEADQEKDGPVKLQGIGQMVRLN